MRNDFFPFSQLTDEEKARIFEHLGLSEKAERKKYNYLFSVNKDVFYNPCTLEQRKTTAFRFGTESYQNLRNTAFYLRFDNQYECLVWANTLEQNGIAYSGVIKENGEGTLTISKDKVEDYKELKKNNRLAAFPRSLGNTSRKTLLEGDFVSARAVIPFDNAIALSKKLAQAGARYRLEIKASGEGILYFEKQYKELVIEDLKKEKKPTRGITL